MSKKSAASKAALTKAMKLAEQGASGFTIARLVRKLDLADRIGVFEVLAAHPEAPEEAPDMLAKCYAEAGRFADAVRTAKKGCFWNTLHVVGEAALDGGAFREAEAAFTAIDEPSATTFVAVAIAQKKAGKNPDAALAHAAAANVAKKPVEWRSATSAGEQVRIAIVEAMIAAIRGDAAGARRALEDARERIKAIPQKSARKECDEQLAAPSDPQWWASTIARHAGL